MPAHDGTGPRGMGAMTGGGRGFCNPLGTRRGFGVFRGLGARHGRGAAGGYGRGRGFGLGRFAHGGSPEPGYAPSVRYGEPVSASEEREVLQQQLSAIGDQLAQISERLKATGE
ncbi:DUF5320 domain-containing protein [Candidatus Bipolaricaulota bacterium]